MSKNQRIAPFLSFYCFKQNFRCVEDLTEELAGIATDICNLAETSKQTSWFEFWQAQGNEIVLRLWKIKYKDYIDETIEERSLSEVLLEEELGTDKTTAPLTNPITEDFSLNESDINDVNALSWETLWNEHSAEVYAEQYKKFEDIYENYYWVLKEALSNQIETKKSKTDLLNEFANGFEELKLAGLPTAFGNKTKLKQRNRKVKNRKKNDQEYFYELTDTDFNEEDSDSDIYFSATDTSDNEFEMPPTKHNSPNESSEQNNDEMHTTSNKLIAKPKKNRMLRAAPAFMQVEKQMQKYWRKRFSLFSRFDEGIQLDRESWFSVTPEKVAKHMAHRICRDVRKFSSGSKSGLTIVDGFCGCGGNTIQFAMTCNKVIAIDIDSNKIEMAKHNANIYGVSDKIEFIVGDFLQISQMGTLKADAVFLSPPWGGPEYNSVETYNIETCLEPVSASELMRVARRISNNIAFFLPRNADLQQIIKLAGVGHACEVEHNFLDKRIVGLTAFYGDCVAKQNL